MKKAGDISIPKNTYKGAGDAILFLRKNHKSICDKVLYFTDIEVIKCDTDGNIVNMPDFEIESDGFYYPLKVMVSSWQACAPSLNIYYDLTERDKFI